MWPSILIPRSSSQWTYGVFCRKIFRLIYLQRLVLTFSVHRSLASYVSLSAFCFPLFVFLKITFPLWTNEKLLSICSSVVSKRYFETRTKYSKIACRKRKLIALFQITSLLTTTILEEIQHWKPVSSIGKLAQTRNRTYNCSHLTHRQK